MFQPITIASRTVTAYDPIIISTIANNVAQNTYAPYVLMTKPAITQNLFKNGIIQGIRFKNNSSDATLITVSNAATSVSVSVPYSTNAGSISIYATSYTRFAESVGSNILTFNTTGSPPIFVSTSAFAIHAMFNNNSQNNVDIQMSSNGLIIRQGYDVGTGYINTTQTIPLVTTGNLSGLYGSVTNISTSPSLSVTYSNPALLCSGVIPPETFYYGFFDQCINMTIGVAGTGASALPSGTVDIDICRYDNNAVVKSIQLQFA
jgi:hypothetical protein